MLNSSEPPGRVRDLPSGHVGPRIGDIVQYRTKPKPSAKDGGYDPDRSLRHNHASCEDTVVVPAIVTRVWGKGTTPALNLLVLADGPPDQAQWRTSVLHEDDHRENASVAGAWKYKERR